MQTTTLIAVVLAPIVGPAMWWVLQAPGRAVYRFLWRKLPDGWVRKVLLKELSGAPSAAPQPARVERLP